MQLMLYNTTDLKIEWLLWALSDVFTDKEVMSATVRIAAARSRGHIDTFGQDRTFKQKRPPGRYVALLDGTPQHVV